MTELTRRNLLAAAGALAAGAVYATPKPATAEKAYPRPQGIPKVYFTPTISDETLVQAFDRVRSRLTGRVAIKLHTGEPGAPYLPPRHLARALQKTVPDSSIVECNTLYDGPRHTTQGHRKLLKENGWTFCPVDIMDAEGEVMLPIPGMKEFFDRQWAGPGMKVPFTPGNHLREIAVGKNLLNYDSLLVYTHFKGHASGGYGGSLKNIAIGCASVQGKRMLHGDGWIKGELFQEHMVEAARGIVSHFGRNVVYVNLLMNMSVDCDCAGMAAAEPKAPDLGILVSDDLWAIDKASVDMVYALPEAQKKDLVERIESRKGLRQLEYMGVLGMSSDSYELIRI